MESITIDGSKGEGGGQILRLALALSCITKKPFKIENIRANRSKPGLQAQHLTSVNAISYISRAVVDGAKIGSTELSFSPLNITGGYYTFDIGTAGSITLLMQSLLPLLVFADRQSNLTLMGGTHVPHSPTIDYYSNVFLPMVRKMGVNAELEIQEFGWYPKGGGKVILYTKPSKLNSIELLEKSDLISINGYASQSNLPEDILTREEKGVREVFPGVIYNKKMKPSGSMGTSLTLWAEYDNTIIGVDSLGKKGLPAEELGSSSARKLNKQIKSKATVDQWMGDQLLIYMALAKGASKIKVPKITGHILSCLDVIPLFTGIEFKIDDDIISVDGIG